MLDTPPFPATDLLRREDAALFLARHGYPISRAGLSLLATRGRGPPVCYFGRWPLYHRADLLAWAQARLSPVSIRQRTEQSA